MAEKQHERESLTLTVGQKVRNARMALGLEREDVAKSAGITEQYLARIERCTSLPSIHIIMSMLDILQLNADQLLGLETAESRSRPDNFENISPELDKLLTEISQLTPGFLRAVILLIKIGDEINDP